MVASGSQMPSSPPPPKSEVASIDVEEAVVVADVASIVAVAVVAVAVAVVVDDVQTPQKTGHWSLAKSPLLPSSAQSVASRRAPHQSDSAIPLHVPGL